MSTADPNSPGPQDDYAVAAEYYDLWSADYWKTLGPDLATSLAGVDPGAGPVLELGAGTGLGTVVVADAVPGAQVVAVEPSRAMRAGLTARLMAREDLHDRVTVLPYDLARMPWPERLGAFVAMAMLGHLAPDERAQLWRDLAVRLGPGAPAVVLLQPPGRPEVVPPTRHTSRRLGALDYEGWSEAEPVGERTLRWTMTYRVLSEGELVDEVHWSSSFHTVSQDDVAAETAEAGLTATAGPGGLVTLRPAF